MQSQYFSSNDWAISFWRPRIPRVLYNVNPASEPGKKNKRLVDSEFERRAKTKKRHLISLFRLTHRDRNLLALLCVDAIPMFLSKRLDHQLLCWRPDFRVSYITSTRLPNQAKRLRKLRETEFERGAKTKKLHLISSFRLTHRDRDSLALLCVNAIPNASVQTA